MSQEREGSHSDDNESFIESKKSWEFGYVNIEMNVSWGKLGVSIWNLNATSKFECQYEDLGTQQNFAEFYEFSQTRESLKLKRNQRFLERWFKASCTGFTEFERDLVALALENKRDKNCVFLDSGMDALWSCHLTSRVSLL